MTIEIQLTRGYVAIVDDCDADLADFKWHAVGRDKHVYARRIIGGTKPRQSLLMHRVILERMLGRELTRAEFPDHEDLNPVNNTRKNLRLADRSKNAGNSPLRKDNPTGFKGVRKNLKSSRWHAVITVNGKTTVLGYFNTPESAHEAYKEAAIKSFGEFARFE